jgi:hypothetical protein
MNKVFDTLLREKIQQFRESFSKNASLVFVDENTGRLRHPGEFGTYRENICKDFIRLFIPGKFDIASGFLMSSQNEISTQCDIVIYDRNSTPLIQNNELQRFFPHETVCAIGEVKSILKKKELLDALRKLANVKKIRLTKGSRTVLHRDREISQFPFSPTKYPYDNIFSFLICEKLGFDVKKEGLDLLFEKYEPEYPVYLRHNLILSIQDGLFGYIDNNGKTLMYPIINDISLKNRLVAPDQDKDIHFKMFASYLFMATTSSTVLFPEMADYMSPTIGGINYQQHP